MGFLLLFYIGYASGQCQQPGSVCYRVTPGGPTGAVGGSCCDQCRPQLKPGATTWDGTTDWFCMYGNDGGPEGGTCGDNTGSCASGLTCTNGVCTSSSTTAASSSGCQGDGSICYRVTSSPTGAVGTCCDKCSPQLKPGASSWDGTTDWFCTSSSTSSSDSTSASGSSDSTSDPTTTTTAEVCDGQPGQVCLNTDHGFSKTCCSPYTCNQYPGSTVISTCTGDNLAAGAECFKNGMDLGNCTSPRTCLESPTTCATNIYPQSYCYDSTLNSEVQPCCNGAICMSPPGETDRFCVKFNIPDGQQCGFTKEEGYRGFCTSPANCVNGACTTNPTTTTSTTTTSTTTTVTEATTTEVCIAKGAECWGGTTSTDPPVKCCEGLLPCPVVSPSATNCPA